MSKTHQNSTYHSSRIESAWFVFVCLVPVVATVLYGSVDNGTWGVLGVLICIMVMFGVADGFLTGTFKYSANPLQIPLLVLVGLGVVQLLPFGTLVPEGLLNIPAASALSLDPYATRLFTLKLIFFTFYFGGALAVLRTPDRIRRVVFGIIIFAALMAFIGDLQRLAAVEGIYGVRPVNQAVPFGPFVNGHHFASLMEMSIGLALTFVFGAETGRFTRLLCIFAAVMMASGIIFTGSRGGFISFISVFLFVVIANLLIKTRLAAESDEQVRAEKLKRLKIAAAAFGIIALLFVVVLYIGADSALLRGTGIVYTGDEVSGGRTHFWMSALKIFAMFPLFGSGLDTFAVAYPLVDTWNGIWRVENAHNEYLNILAEGGLVGIGAVAAFIFLVFKKGLRHVAESRSAMNKNITVGAMAGILGILIHSFFDFPFHTFSNVFFFLLLSILATSHVHFAKHHRKH